MQPFDYRIAVQDPLQMALAGYQQGQQFQQQRVQGERETQLYDMEMQQYEANQAKLQEEQARAKAMQSDFAAFTEGLSSGTATIDDVFRLNGLYPEMAEQVQSVYQMKSDVQKNNEIKESLALASLFRNAPDAGAAKLAEKIAAAEAAGDQERLAGLKSIEASIGISPDAPVAATIFTLSNVMEADQFKLVAEQLGLAPEKVPDSFRADEMRAKAAGLEPGTPEYRDFMMKSGSGTNVSVTVPGGIEEGAFEKKVGELQATSIEAIAQQGQTSRRNRQTINLLENALTGAPAGIEAGLKGLAVNYGIETEGSDQIEVAKALISQLVPGQRPPGSGEMSNADLQLFKDSLPKLMGTSEGRLKIVANMKAISDYMIAEGDLADAVLDGTISRAQYRERVRALGNPLAEFSGGATTSAGLPVINSQAAYDALPSKSKYTTPSGGTRTKP